MNSGQAAGFDVLGGPALNNGYVQWAGITAGKHGSFYDYLAGGDTWNDFFSPDHSGTPTNLLAYTASFGGGFSATISLEQPQNVALRRYGRYSCRTPSTADGARRPRARHHRQLGRDAELGRRPSRWRGAQHPSERCSASPSDLDTWGYGVIGGVTFNLPMLSAGSKLGVAGRLRPRRDRLFRRDCAGVGRAGPGLQHQRQWHHLPDG